MQENDAAAHMAGSRYPRRNRNVVSRPESAQGSGHAASSSKDQDDDQSGSEQVHAQLLHYSCMHAGCIYLCCLAVSYKQVMLNGGAIACYSLDLVICSDAGCNVCQCMHAEIYYRRKGRQLLTDQLHEQLLEGGSCKHAGL